MSSNIGYDTAVNDITTVSISDFQKSLVKDSQAIYDVIQTYPVFVRLPYRRKCFILHLGCDNNIFYYYKHVSFFSQSMTVLEFIASYPQEYIDAAAAVGMYITIAGANGGGKYIF